MLKKGFKDDDEAKEWADSQKQGKYLFYAIEPEEGWIDPAGTWHPDQNPDDEDFYDPTSAYESEEDDTEDDTEEEVNEDWGSSDQSIMNNSIHDALGKPKEFPELDQLMAAAEDAVDFYWDDWEEYQDDRDMLINKAARAYLRSFFPDLYKGFTEMFAVEEAASQKVNLAQIVSWLKSHGFKLVSSEKNQRHRKWAEGGKWKDLVKVCKAIGGQHKEIDLGSFKDKVIFGLEFQN